MKLAKSFAVVIPVLAVVLLLLVPSLMAQSVGPKVLKPDTVVFGRTYSEWSAAWEQWADSIPASHHPLFDTADCSTGQSGPVWFLGGKFCYNTATDCGYSNIVRTCNVPGNKALYIAVVNAEDSALEDPGNPQIAGLRAGSASAIDGVANVVLTVDGAAVPDLKSRFRVQSTAFGFTLPEDNFFKAIYPVGYADFKAGTYFPGEDDGVYVMLSPLPAGMHVIHFSAYFPAYNFGFDVTYTLNVGN